jgi:hypothetical protein
MAANTLPIFSKIAALGINGANTLGTALDAVYNGTSANAKIAFTADSTNGAYVQFIRLKALGTNAIAKLKIYINNGTGTEGSLTAATCSFFGEISLPATTASTTAATSDVTYPMNIALPPGYRIVLGIDAGGNLASGWAYTVVAGTY